LKEQGSFDFHDLLKFASAISELNLDLTSANQAILLAEEALIDA
jgi:hypothetical protein